MLKLTALDWNSNATELTLALEKAEGEIAGFSVTTGNKNTVTDREALPGTTSYIVQELRNGEQAISDPRRFLDDCGQKVILDEIQRVPNIFP